MVLTELDPVRHFNQSDLRRLFTLSPRGTCELYEKFKKEGRAMLYDKEGKHSFVKAHGSVVAVTRHDGVYADEAAKAKTSLFASSNNSAALFGGKKGRAQRVLSQENTDALALGGRKSVRPKAQNELAVPCPKEDVQQQSNFTTLLQRSSKLKAKGMHRRALQGLSELLEPAYYEKLNRDEKMKLHSQIALHAEPLGLLEDTQVRIQS